MDCHSPRVPSPGYSTGPPLRLLVSRKHSPPCARSDLGSLRLHQHFIRIHTARLIDWLAARFDSLVHERHPLHPSSTLAYYCSQNLFHLTPPCQTQATVRLQAQAKYMVLGAGDSAPPNQRDHQGRDERHIQSRHRSHLLHNLVLAWCQMLAPELVLLRLLVPNH